MEKYNKLIDHTLLRSDASPEDIAKLCDEAKQFGFASVCINPFYVPLAASLLKGSDVKVCTVIGFPLGSNMTKTKIQEAQLALHNGADEFDMVINIGMLKSANYDYVEEEIRLIKEAIGKKILKVIIETCLLTDDEKIHACICAKTAGADFVKTSTGFSKSGATVHDVELIRKTVGPDMGVKASGGIKTHDDLVTMINAGANRIGTSSGIKII